MKNISTKSLLSALGLLLLGAGCLPSPQKMAEGAIEASINNQIGAEGTVDINGGSVSFTDKDTGTVGSYGENVTIPDDFPQDMPILEGGTVSGVAVNTEGAWIAFSTEMSADAVIEWYESRLLAEGWVKQGTYSADATVTAAYEKGEEILGVMAATSATSTIVTVSKSTK